MTNTLQQQIVKYSFGDPVFSYPDRVIVSERNGSEMLANVRIPILGVGLVIESGLWLNRVKVKGGDQIELRVSMSLPRGLRVAPELGAADAVDALKARVANEFIDWDRKMGGNPAKHAKPAERKAAYAVLGTVESAPLTASAEPVQAIQAAPLPANAGPGLDAKPVQSTAVAKSAK